MIETGDQLKTIGDFTEVRELYGEFGLTYPDIGDIVTVMDVYQHPADKNGSMLVLKEHKNHISLEHVSGVNFERETQTD